MKSKLVVLLLSLVLPIAAFCKNLTPVIDVFNRVAPWTKNKIIVKAMDKADTFTDAFELSMKHDKLIIRATSIPAAGMAFNHYLKYYCHQNFSLTGSNLKELDQLPPLDKKIFRSTTAEYRHIFNFCTLNYSAAFWKWEEWQKAIDYMVLNGVNLALTPVGMEKIWYNTLRKMDFTEKEIFDFLPGPAFNAWHMMANLEGWGGPINKNLIDQRAKLAKKILTTLKAFEISPIYMSFYGMVPTKLKEKYPKADIIPQGNWVGGFLRPYILSPLDPLYDKMADIYYKEIKKNYGTFNFFAGEPFHEGGTSKGIDVSKLSFNVLKKIREFNPNAQWCLQSWGGNPSDEFLSSLSPQKDIIIWDFSGERKEPLWDTKKGYGGYPFLWGVINNFGETTGLFGKLQYFIDEYHRANTAYPANMKGLGASPEGILNNPVNFDLLYEIPWHEKTFAIKDWLKNYVTFRYGEYNESMYKVWSILAETAYSSSADSKFLEPLSKELPDIAGNPESVVCAPPSLDVHCTSSWGTSFIFYDAEKMKRLIPYLLEATQSLKGVDAFEYDMVNITRQLLSNEFYKCYATYQTQVKNKELDSLNKTEESMLKILDDLDKLLSSRSEFMVGAWIKAARNYGSNQHEQDLYEWNARSQISYWGKDIENTSLRDYAHKEWAGLIKDLYKPRWQAFFQAVREQLATGKEVPTHPTRMSIQWSKQKNVYPAQPTQQANVIAPQLLKALQIDESCY